MEVILTKSVRKLGKVGETVNVANGYARNYLLPQELAIRATQDNITRFDSIKKDLEQKNKDNLSEAKKSIESIKGKNLIFAVQSSADGRLFGSITAKSIADKLSNMTGLNLKYHNIIIHDTIKSNDVYEANVSLHADVMTTITIVVAKTEEEGQVALQMHKEGLSKSDATSDNSQEKITAEGDNTN